MKQNRKVTRNPADGNISRLCFDNSSINCDHFGGLYMWGPAMNLAGSSNTNPSGVQGICLDGWHVPSVAALDQLVNFVISQGHIDAGNRLKSCRKVNSPLGGSCNTSQHPRWEEHTSSSYHHGFDTYSFSALPGGLRSYTFYFHFIGASGTWWTTTKRTSGDAFIRQMTNSSSDVIGNHNYKANALSVRCLKD